MRSRRRHLDYPKTPVEPEQVPGDPVALAFLAGIGNRACGEYFYLPVQYCMPRTRPQFQNAVRPSCVVGAQQPQNTDTEKLAGAGARRSSRYFMRPVPDEPPLCRVSCSHVVHCSSCCAVSKPVQAYLKGAVCPDSRGCVGEARSAYASAGQQYWSGERSVAE